MEYILKNIDYSNSDDIFEIYSNKEILKFTDSAIHLSKEDSNKLINWFLAGEKNNSHLYKGIFLNDKLIGVVGIYHIDWKHKFASINCILNNKFWRKGIMTNALKFLVSESFNNYKLNRLEAQVYENHIASVNLFKKLGFKKEALLRRNFLIEGKFENSYLLTLLNEEYKNNINFYK